MPDYARMCSTCGQPACSSACVAYRAWLEGGKQGPPPPRPIKPHTPGWYIPELKEGTDA